MKEAVHELGHTFGLIHCSDARCAMSLSNAIQQVDKKTEELCTNCSILFGDITKHIRRGNGMEI
jgi:archaemetzincin